MEFKRWPDLCKWLILWSGRPDSNRRRPAWEYGWRLKIKYNGVQGDEYRSIEFSNFRNSLFETVLNGVKMEWKLLRLSSGGERLPPEPQNRSGIRPSATFAHIDPFTSQKPFEVLVPSLLQRRAVRYLQSDRCMSQKRSDEIAVPAGWENPVASAIEPIARRPRPNAEPPCWCRYTQTTRLIYAITNQ